MQQGGEEMLWGSDKQTYGHFNFIFIMISLAALPSTLAKPLGKKLVPMVCTWNRKSFVPLFQRIIPFTLLLCAQWGRELAFTFICAL